MAKPEDLVDLPYYHGALPDEDADRMLAQDGDYLVQMRHGDGVNPRFVLAVRTGPRKTSQVRRFDVVRVKGGYHMLGRDFPTMKAASDYHCAHGVSGIQLRRAVPRSKFQITHRDIHLNKKIGSGAYGTVFRGQLTLREKERPRKIEVAVKRLESEGRGEQGLAEMMKEARYNHVNIVRFFGFVIDRAPYLLVMELCAGGSVEDRLRLDGGNITTAARIDMVCQAACGMEYLHEMRCIHRDIATRNCLMQRTTLKLADFGMSRATAIYKIDLSKPQNVRWLAPEVWLTGETKFCTDVYAFGVMIWELFIDPYQSPYNEMKAIQVKERVMNGYRMETPTLMPDVMAQLMKACWAQEPSARPTAEQLRGHAEQMNRQYNPQKYDDAPKTARPRSQMSEVRSFQGSMQSALKPPSNSKFKPAGSRARTPPKRQDRGRTPRG